jgi:hypothetical protein
MIPPGPLFRKPKSIIAAKNILYATILLVILSALLGEFSTNLHNLSSRQGLVTTVITLGLLFIATHQIALGRKWARTLLLILIIMGLLAAPYYVPFIFKESMAFGFLFVLQSILQIIALVFSYKKNSTLWFNSFKADAR